MARERHPDLDIGRGLLMLFLVFNHSYNMQFPAGNDWYIFLYHVSYWYQMQFFFFITGITMALSGLPKTLDDYAAFLKKRFWRLIPAYVVMATIIFAGKMTVQSIGNVGEPLSGFSAYLTVFISPKTSPYASFLWFIYVLFLFSAVAPPLLRLARGRAELLILPALVLHFLPLPDFLALNLCGRYFIFLVLGIAVYDHYPAYLRIVDKYVWLLLLVFAGMCALAVNVTMNDFPVSVCAIPALHGLCRTGPVVRSRLLALLGQYMYPIYLFNTIFINVARGLILRFVSWDGHAFLLILPVLMTVGIWGPIWTQRNVIPRIPLLRKVFT
ncbi:acyltransferase family protein [Fundidesulfovibrio soli]|uniref:acyltransferase family protein n=1 Tax=Fundidesulfovibrio soli TaxID=2922716 RepID=UPI001FAE78B7|nr:acyltransferase [Fundidesulfovibrio soli]